MDKKIYYPYKSNYGKYKYYIITKSGRKISFSAFGIVIIQNITMTPEKNDLLNAIRKGKNGLNQVLIRPAGGVYIYYGTRKECKKFIEDMEKELKNIIYFTVEIYDNSNNKIETKEYNFKWDLLLKKSSIYNSESQKKLE